MFVLGPLLSSGGVAALMRLFSVSRDPEWTILLVVGLIALVSGLALIGFALKQSHGLSSRIDKIKNEQELQNHDPSSEEGDFLLL